MKTKIVDVTNGANWGKVLVGEFDTERDHIGLDGTNFFAPRWNDRHRLETGEGAIFAFGGYAFADLNKHKVWVCPMFEPLLEWLYENFTTLDELPATVELPNAPAALYGYRRGGSP